MALVRFVGSLARWKIIGCATPESVTDAGELPVFTTALVILLMAAR